VEEEIYLDNNATTRPLAEVREAMLAALDAGYGNPSSDHLRGRRSRDALYAARSSVAALVGADSSQLIFTSSASEANNLILYSAVARAAGGRARIVTSPVEHSSVIKVTAQS
jgi:cysteine desulfurase